jgi:hypothetical protein
LRNQEILNSDDLSPDDQVIYQLILPYLNRLSYPTFKHDSLHNGFTAVVVRGNTFHKRINIDIREGELVITIGRMYWDSYIWDLADPKSIDLIYNKLEEIL